METMDSEHIREDPAIELQQNRGIKPDENNQQVKDQEQIVICQDANEPDYPHGIKLAVVIGSLAASVFLVALVIHRYPTTTPFSFKGE